MGTNKALLQLNGKTVIEGMVEKLEKIVDDTIVVTNTFEDVMVFTPANDRR